jgi:hypothetical protein
MFPKLLRHQGNVEEQRLGQSASSGFAGVDRSALELELCTNGSVAERRR